ncbi:hypothetical protein E2542_SST30245 [Spatholobus suberectus]|nr:hypothetical protein E2542_SST30245 [Spatholobus suberectus]
MQWWEGTCHPCAAKVSTLSMRPIRVQRIEEVHANALRIGQPTSLALTTTVLIKFLASVALSVPTKCTLPPTAQRCSKQAAKGAMPRDQVHVSLVVLERLLYE